jgi:predicted nucleotidyltransferase component of viral defense system
MKKPKNAMALKAKIKNIAKEKAVSAQVILQNYFFERFLDRLSRSPYRENFIIKGGLLIAAMAGLETRSTMDMDATIRFMPLDEEHIKTVINSVCAVTTDDDIFFKINGITNIREDNEYGGLRVSLDAIYEKINAPLSVDITAGDVITPSPVKIIFKSLFNDAEQFELWAYNTETILAEKVETILRRSANNTRPRDFYDVYLITKTQNYDMNIFRKALLCTSTYRETTEKIKNIPEIINTIKESPFMKQQWEKYRREYSYAKDISFEDTIRTLSELLMKK